MKSLLFISLSLSVFNATFSQCIGPECCYDGTHWDNVNGECVVSVVGDINNDGCIATDDLLGFLAKFGECQDLVDSVIMESVISFNCGDDVSHYSYDYSTIQIGSQCWFSENCRYLPSIDVNTYSISTPKYYVYNYSGPSGTDVTQAVALSNYQDYGALYNWPAVMSGGLCPSGWYIPTEGDWDELIAFLYPNAGVQLKATYSWESPMGWSGNGSNSSGFTGLAGGQVNQGVSEIIGGYGHWWSSSSGQANYPNSAAFLDVQIHSDAANVTLGPYYLKDFGFSARCVEGTMPIVLGCTSPTSCNYDMSANSDDGTCIFIGDECDDDVANTFTDLILPDCTCSGTIACPCQGSLVINEIMNNPTLVADNQGEWFEVQNISPSGVNIQGVELLDFSGDTHVISSSIIVPSGGIVVLGNNADFNTNGGVQIDYEYSNFTLSNSSDEIILSCNGVVIDEVHYDTGQGFPNGSGGSLSLNSQYLNSDDNDNSISWCLSISTFGVGDLGTPGIVNDDCASFQNCGDYVSYEGYDYLTTQIGEQCWFAENCKYIPYVNSLSEYSVNNPRYYVHGYDGNDLQAAMSPTTNYDVYGVLYNSSAVVSGEICPSGWHVPTDFDFIEMEIYLGLNDNIAYYSGWRGVDHADKMKSSLLWPNGNYGQTSTLNILPGSYYQPELYYSFWGTSYTTSPLWGAVGINAHLWTTTTFYYGTMKRFALTDVEHKVAYDSMGMAYGLSVRCMKNQGGCTDTLACNYDRSANYEDCSCEYLDALGVCDGACVADVDDDGVCDSVDDCIGIVDACGICNGDGSTCTGFQQCGDMIWHEGYNYSTVLVGSKCWYSENNRYLPQVNNLSDNLIWNYPGNYNTSDMFFVNGYNGNDIGIAKSQQNYADYGVLYSSVTMSNLCPTGWHVSSDIDWQDLESFLLMSTTELSDVGWRGVDQGNKIKSVANWNNNNGTDVLGFNALPGGWFVPEYRYYTSGFGWNWHTSYAAFISPGEVGYFWSKDLSGNNYRRNLKDVEGGVERDVQFSISGYSIRCVLD